MSEKKAKQQPQAKVAEPTIATAVKKEPKPPKVPKVARGTARRIRRTGLVKGWKNIKGAKPMLPPGQVAVETPTPT